MIQNIQLQKITDFGNKTFPKNDFLAIEEPLEISLKIHSVQGISPLSVTMRTPGNDEELAIGFLFTEGIISSKKNIEKKATTQLEENKIIVRLSHDFVPDLEKLKRNFYTSSSCGICGKESIEAIKQVRKTPLKKGKIPLDIKPIFGLPEKLRNAQQIFESTGGIHATALFDWDGNLLQIREDVGRHNALDKLIGAELLKSETENFGLENRILLLSGRASFELIQKAAMAGISVVAAIGAPSSLAVETSKEFGITLIDRKSVV